MSDGSAPMPPFYSVAKVAEALDVCTRTVRNWIHRGELHANHPGRQFRISEADLRAFLEQRRK
jgi:excisionase family DNA binding protein